MWEVSLRCRRMVPEADRTDERTPARAGRPPSRHLYVLNARVTGGVHVDGGRLGGDEVTPGTGVIT